MGVDHPLRYQRAPNRPRLPSVASKESPTILRYLGVVGFNRRQRHAIRSLKCEQRRWRTNQILPISLGKTSTTHVVQLRFRGDDDLPSNRCISRPLVQIFASVIASADLIELRRMGATNTAHPMLVLVSVCMVAAWHLTGMLGE